jgi:hypothetical protein
MWHRSKTIQSAFGRGVVLTVVIFGLAEIALADVQPATVAPLIVSGSQSTHPAGIYSAGLAEIVKLLDAKMDAPVILAYIQNSPVAYYPDATELIALKDHGASPDVLVALLHHGDELRRQWAQAQRSVNPQPVATGYGNNPATTYPTYPYDYSDVSYSTTYPATYYNYGYYNYGWPVVYWPPVPFNGGRPNLLPHGRFPPHGGAGRNVSGGVHPGWAGAGPLHSNGLRPVSAPIGGHGNIPAVHAGGFSVSAPMGGHGSFPAVHGGGFRGPGSPGGRAGGRR